jgi:hypothetical protein
MAAMDRNLLRAKSVANRLLARSSLKDTDRPLCRTSTGHSTAINSTRWATESAVPNKYRTFNRDQLDALGY